MSHRDITRSGAFGILLVLLVLAFVGATERQAPSDPSPNGSALATYEREAFGHGWADLDGDGCNSREETLARDLDEPVLDGCDVVYGVLADPYTGTDIVVVDGDTSGIDIDHVVPLAYAWAAGANAWTEAERIEFANNPANLLAVDDGRNQAKGARGPSEWAPPTAFQCDYARLWRDVLAAYPLNIPSADKAWLAQAC